MPRLTVSTVPAILLCLLLAHGAGRASELVYFPVNPNFGGAPSNGPGLLAGASATNRHGLDASTGGSLLNQTPLQQFNQTMERMVLSQLASAATSKLMGHDGKLAPGTFTTDNFIITVTDLGGGMLRVTTTERSTGTVTTFEVGQ